jgi:hypothetical protein
LYKKGSGRLQRHGVGFLCSNEIDNNENPTDTRLQMLQTCWLYSNRKTTFSLQEATDLTKLQPLTFKNPITSNVIWGDNATALDYCIKKEVGDCNATALDSFAQMK